MAEHERNSGRRDTGPGGFVGSVSEILKRARGACRRQEFAAAETMLRQLLDQEPAVAAAWHLRGVAAHGDGRLADAAAHFARAVSLDPEKPRTCAMLGDMLERLQRPAEAAVAWTRAMTLSPDDAAYRARLAALLHRLGDAEAAVTHYRAAQRLRTDWPEIHSNLAAALRDCGRPAEAVAACEQALELRADFPSALNNLALALCDLDRHDDARAPLRRALSLAPDNLDTMHNFAVVQHRTGEFAAAEATLRALLEARPDWPEAQRSLGNLLRENGEIDEAARCYRAVLDRRPQDFKTYANLGLVLINRNRPHEAIAVYEKALALRPDNADLRMSLGIAQLMAGDFAAGWENYEARWHAAGFATPKRDFHAPLWQGEALAADSDDMPPRRLLIHAEQGFGDTLQFCRYAPLIASAGGTVVVECQPALHRLLKCLAHGGSAGAVVVAQRGEALPPVDFHAPMLSLPRILKTEIDSVPADTPYLRAVKSERDSLMAHMDPDALNVGLVWSGNPERQDDLMRSCPPKAMRPILDSPGCRFHSLQLGWDAPLPDGVEDLAPYLDDFAATAAAVEALDLTISVDTAVAHLAGALGRPVWVMLGHAADWRYFMDRDDSPWYPTMRLFRQAVPGDWEQVARRIAQALTADASQNSLKDSR